MVHAGNYWQERVELEELKEKVRQMLVEIPDNSTQKLKLIDTFQRLGVAYHFKNEIKTSIQIIFNASQQSENEDDNLYVVALSFRQLREQSQPIYTNLPRLGAKKYLCMYENKESHNDLLLKFAILDFNIVQKLHQRELGDLTRYIHYYYMLFIHMNMVYSSNKWTD